MFLNFSRISQLNSIFNSIWKWKKKWFFFVENRRMGIDGKNGSGYGEIRLGRKCFAKNCLGNNWSNEKKFWRRKFEKSRKSWRGAEKTRKFDKIREFFAKNFNFERRRNFKTTGSSGLLQGLESVPKWIWRKKWKFAKIRTKSSSNFGNSVFDVKISSNFFFFFAFFATKIKKWIKVFEIFQKFTEWRKTKNSKLKMKTRFSSKGYVTEN